MRSGIVSAVLVVGLLILALCVGSGQEKPDEGTTRIERPPTRLELPEPGPNKIAYHRHVSDAEHSQVFRSRVGATGELQLTHGDSAEFPRWSPAGERIAYALGRAEHRIHIMHEDGSGDREVLTGDVHGIEPSWAPNSSLLAFAGLRDHQWDIWTMEIDGRHLTNLTDSELADYHPDWSPNGRSIAYDHYEGADTDYEIYKIEVADRRQTRLTSNGTYDGMPRWSRDGTKIVFCRKLVVPGLPGRETPLKGAPGLEIYVMDADGSDQTRLTNRAGDDYCPCWSEDGSEILWLHGDRRGSDALWAMKADGTDQRQVREELGTSLDCWGPLRPLPEIHPGTIIRPRPGG
jgi:Tol biopolymer transport system component